MKRCLKCNHKLIRVFNGEIDYALALESFKNEIIIGNSCKNENNYYCAYCDEFFNI